MHNNKMAMTYKQLLETLTIAAKYNGGIDADADQLYGSYKEIGIDFDNTPSAEELRKLSKMGWHITHDDDDILWQTCDDLTDEQVIMLFEYHNRIFLYT